MCPAGAGGTFRARLSGDCREPFPSSHGLGRAAHRQHRYCSPATEDLGLPSPSLLSRATNQYFSQFDRKIRDFMSPNTGALSVSSM